MTLFESYSQKSTEELGRMMGLTALPGDVFALIGDLAAGKTAFARGFARGLGVDDDIDIVSPTFGIVNEYNQGRLPLYHFDVYRIQHIQEMEDTGYQEYFFGQGVTLIEWADMIEEILPKGTVYVNIARSRVHGEEYRRIEVTT